ncbi:MAG: hypothetical protein AAFW70_27980, partial [Cyanobacteria bacterium J06635_10]
MTSELHDVVGIETINPSRTTILGLCKVIPQEYPQIHCQNIDVVIPSNNNQSLENTAKDLITEVYKPKDMEMELAYNQIISWCNEHGS